jgi:hypothetical protein
LGGCHLDRVASALLGHKPRCVGPLKSIAENPKAGCLSTSWIGVFRTGCLNSLAHALNGMDTKGGVFAADRVLHVSLASLRHSLTASLLAN